MRRIGRACVPARFETRPRACPLGGKICSRLPTNPGRLAAGSDVRHGVCDPAQNRCRSLSGARTVRRRTTPGQDREIVHEYSRPHELSSSIFLCRVEDIRAESGRNQRCHHWNVTTPNPPDTHATRIAIAELTRPGPCLGPGIRKVRPPRCHGPAAARKVIISDPSTKVASPRRHDVWRSA